MATIGTTLTSPEAGWRRYDDSDSRIKRIGTDWAYSANASMYNGGVIYSDIGFAERSINFKFKGTNLRILTAIYTTDILTNLVTVKIDNVVMGTFKQNDTQGIYQCLVFEKLGLDNSVHLVELICPEKQFYIDAIDIDSTGYLLHPTLIQRSKIEDMEIGDCIPCKYTAMTSGVAGTFSELGTCIANEIPLAGSATPNGLFYFIKNDKGLLIADRVIQTNITWNTLNAAKYIEGAASTYINPAVVSTNVSTSLLNTPAYLPNLFVPSLLNNVNFYFDAAPPALIYVQFEYPDSHLLTSIQVNASANAAGMEPISKFSIKGSVSGDFTDEELIYSDTYTALGGWQTFNIPSTKKFKKFRFYVDSWTVDNGGGGSNIRGIAPYFSDYKIRSIAGGNSYTGTDSKASLTNKNLGIFPTNNEWDKYIIKSNLNGKITPGDDTIWNKSLTTFCVDTAILNLQRSVDSVLATNVSKIMRGTSDATIWGNITTTSNGTGGFRPVIEYPDDSKCTNLWY